MTINKSQGQSLSHVGLYLKKPVFSHGQVYVAMSRVTNYKGLKILICDRDDGRTRQFNNKCNIFSRKFSKICSSWLEHQFNFFYDNCNAYMILISYTFITISIMLFKSNEIFNLNIYKFIFFSTKSVHRTGDTLVVH